jgi:hypothetical protein
MAAKRPGRRPVAGGSPGAAGSEATVLHGDAPAGRARPMTISSYFSSFGPVPAWDDLCAWPPDVFALTNLILDYTEGYRLAVAPPKGQRWPPVPGWNERVSIDATEWRSAAGQRHGAVPEAVLSQWAVITRFRDSALSSVPSQVAWELMQALLTLHAIADEACAGLAVDAPDDPSGFERRAWRLLDEQGSLARISPNRIRILPKTHFAARGITIRSLSRYLGLTYESIDLRWRRFEPGDRPGGGMARREYNVVLVPWPLRIAADAFRPVEGPLQNMDRRAFGFFEFVPDAALDAALLAAILAEARRRVPTVDAVVFPEASVDAGEIPTLEAVLADSSVTFLIAGVRERPTTPDGLGRNYIHVGVRTWLGWERFQQEKHHRWCLDEGQIRQYHLGRMLDASRQWWEAIDLPPRMVQIIDVGGATFAPLVCEDLARMDEVMELLRRVGPSLILAVLLDGPQLPTRWPCRYASVLVDDPGSAVLTLTSFGMVARSRPAGMKRSRVVALWHDTATGRHELELARGAAGILITASIRAKTVWTADGRRHEGETPELALSRVRQLRPPASPAARRASRA